MTLVKSELLVVFCYTLAIISSTNVTCNLQGLETKVIELQNQLDILKQDVYGKSAFCSLLSNETCGPCLCRDDPRTLKRYYCDCQHVLPRRDCLEFKLSGFDVDGIYQVKQLGLKTIQVYCDQTTDGGGWTVIQRRVDGSENFYRDWDDYKRGFGYLQHEHWLGNQHVHTLELQSKFGGGTELRVDLMNRQKVKGFAKYSWFEVGSERTKYKLHVGGYNGSIPDCLTFQNGMMFTTIDQDNDLMSGNSAVKYNGPWWTKVYSTGCNLNGQYYHIGKAVTAYAGIWWNPWVKYTDSLLRTEMKIRRKM